jgi:hypothetical protein
MAVGIFAPNMAGVNRFRSGKARRDRRGQRHPSRALDPLVSLHHLVAAAFALAPPGVSQQRTDSRLEATPLHGIVEKGEPLVETCALPPRRPRAAVVPTGRVQRTRATNASVRSPSVAVSTKASTSGRMSW